jgi:hypothetical protein
MLGWKVLLSYQLLLLDKLLLQNPSSQTSRIIYTATTCALQESIFFLITTPVLLIELLLLFLIQKLYTTMQIITHAIQLDMNLHNQSYYPIVTSVIELKFLLPFRMRLVCLHAQLLDI